MRGTNLLDATQANLPLVGTSLLCPCACCHAAKRICSARGSALLKQHGPKPAPPPHLAVAPCHAAHQLLEVEASLVLVEPPPFRRHHIVKQVAAAGRGDGRFGEGAGRDG